MGLGGVDYMFFNSGSEIMFMQEAIAKANALGRPAPKLDHDDPRISDAQRGARLCGGDRADGGDRGARRRRHPALRLRDPHRTAFRPAGADHRRRAAGLLSRLDARRARRQPFLGAADARSERHRAPVHEVGSPARIPGQSRPDRQPRAADRAVRAARSGLSQPAARDRVPAGRRRALPDRAAARHHARAGARSRRRRANWRNGWSRRATRRSSFSAPAAIRRRVPALVRLAELLGAPVGEAAARSYQCFPMDHPLYQSINARSDARPTSCW